MVASANEVRTALADLAGFRSPRSTNCSTIRSTSVGSPDSCCSSRRRRATWVPRRKSTLRRFDEGRVNNWDLVDSSAEFLLGGWLVERDRHLLFELGYATEHLEPEVRVHYRAQR